MSVRTRTFKSGNSEAVRLPQDMAFGVGVELTLERSGDVLTLRRVRPTMAQVIEELRTLPAPGAVEVRDMEPLPEREGL